MFNATGYFGDDEIYYAIYLHEHTQINLKRKICTKFSIDFNSVADVLVVYPGGGTCILSDEFVENLLFEQTLEIEVEDIVPYSRESNASNRLLMRIRT